MLNIVTVISLLPLSCRCIHLPVLYDNTQNSFKHILESERDVKLSQKRALEGSLQEKRALLGHGGMAA